MELSMHNPARVAVQLQVSNNEGFHEILRLLTFYLNNIFRLLLIMVSHKNLISPRLKSIFKTSVIGVHFLESPAISGFELHTKLRVLQSSLCNMTSRGCKYAKQ